MSVLRTNLRWSCLLTGYIFSCVNSLVQNRNLVKMAELAPPPSVRGMKKLDRKLFDVTVTVPCLVIDTALTRFLTGILKSYLLKLRHLKPVRPLIIKEDVVEESREVLLNPKVVTGFSDIQPAHREQLQQFQVTEGCFRTTLLHLTYDNWTADDILKAVLPDGVETASSYSIVGHIVHLNLREHLLDYKYLIGELLLDKIKPARTVVNKVDNIENTFRVFNMEVLAGEPQFVTEVKENLVKLKFDFSSVYWNPRLSTEHQRITDKLQPGNVLYDVFAGVGPFAIPAAKKKCTVLANDLNPDSYKWLKHNAKSNKVETNLSAYNKDGRDFIKEEVKQHMLQEEGKRKSHVVMNLPALAVTFLREFKNLFTSDQLVNISTLPLIHVYCFVKGEGDLKEMAKELVENELNSSISESLDEILFVRNVAPNKDMMRVSFQLTENIILDGKRKRESKDAENTSKKSK